MPTDQPSRTALREFPLYIDGEFAPAAGGEWFSSVDPYSGENWAAVARGTAVDADRALAAAECALDGPWGAMRGADRARLLRRLAEVVTAHTDELAEVEIRDNGKPARDARAQVAYLAEWIYYFAGLADKIEGRAYSDMNPNFFVYTVREPVGVVAAVLPWNAPLILLVFKLAPALAAGCTVVAKPSEFTPASTLAFARCVHEAGFPPGVFNVVASDSRDLGAALVSDQRVRKVAFTGSTQTGIAVAQAAMGHLASVTLELGGKSPQLIFDDADVEQATNGIVSGAFAASGQFCTAGSRVLVHRSVVNEVTERLAERAEQACLGDPREVTTDIGPISTPPQHQRVLDMLSSAREQGARFVTGGHDAPEVGPYFIRPTVLTDVTPEMAVMTDEIFGPVVGIMPFDDEEEAVRLANDTIYGLAAGVWTTDVRRAHRVAGRLKAGTVWVNAYRTSSPAVPFGGMKASGLGRENGLEVVEAYTETKAVWIETAGEMRDPFRIG